MIHLLQMDVRTGRDAPMIFFVVPSGWAESPSGWSQSPVVQRVAPREHKPGRFVANGTMQSIRPDPADPFSTSHCHVRLFRCYWAHVTELTTYATQIQAFVDNEKIVDVRVIKSSREIDECPCVKNKMKRKIKRERREGQEENSEENL